MTKLSDTQLILLSTASVRDDGSVFPLPGAIAATGGGAAKSVSALLKRGLVEERETTHGCNVHRSHGDLSYGVYLTDAGRAAINVDDGGDGAAGGEVPPSPTPPAAGAPTKGAAVLALLQRPEGATPAELIAATGWLPHTTRAALTGIRKKGHAVERSKRGQETCYRVVSGS
jgi:hypothetical protein